MLKKLFTFYMFLPFIIAFLAHILINLKNKVILRLIAKMLCSVNFLVFAFLFFTGCEKKFSVCNISFLINDVNLVFLLFNSIIFLVFVFLSKTFIQKFSKIFFSNFILFLGLINCFLLSDSIFFSFICLFLIFLLNSLFAFEYAKTKEVKTDIKVQFASDFVVLFVAAFLILFDFARYYILNDINLNYSNIKAYLPYISDGASITAFFGFLLLAFRLFNFLAGNNFVKQISKTNNFVVCLNLFIITLLGGYYFINVYNIFDFLFFKFQNYIALFLILNLLYNIILSYRKDNILKSVLFLFFSNAAFCVFAFFAFDEFSKEIFVYYLFACLFGYLLLASVLIIQERKIKTLDFDKIACGLVKNKNVQILTLFSLLNISFVPFMSVFTAIIALSSCAFTIRYDSLILNYCVYLLVFGLFLISLNVYNLIYKILIEPSKRSVDEIYFAFHQRFALWVLVFLNLLFGIFGFSFLNTMAG